MLFKSEKIGKFPNRLYFLQSYTIAIRGNVTTDFRIHSHNVIVRAKWQCQLNVGKYGIKEKVNQNDDRIG